MKQPVLYLADDDDDDIYLARLTFTAHFPDWKLVSFEDGQTLIDYLSLHEQEPLPDFIILDLNMPRLTGFETLMLLKRHKRWKTVPVAILSTSDHVADQQRTQAMGACAFMVKPASAGQLADLILAGKSSCGVQA